jgi:hypothetical protein
MEISISVEEMNALLSSVVRSLVNVSILYLLVVGCLTMSCPVVLADD